MYITDIRGFSAEEYFVCSKEDCYFSTCGKGKEMLFSKAKRMCKITIHGLGVRGNKGISLHFAKFCMNFCVNPEFISVSDMGISFFVECLEKDRVLDALCDFFPIWV